MFSKIFIHTGSVVLATDILDASTPFDPLVLGVNKPNLWHTRMVVLNGILDAHPLLSFNLSGHILIL